MNSGSPRCIEQTDSTFCFLSFEIRSTVSQANPEVSKVAEIDFELMTFLFQPHTPTTKCWDYRYMLPYLVLCSTGDQTQDPVKQAL